MQLQVTSQLFRSFNNELESKPAVQDLSQLLVEEAAKWTQQSSSSAILHAQAVTVAIRRVPL